MGRTREDDRKVLCVARNPTYMYQFGYLPAAMRVRSRYGAGHGSDVSFVFNSLHARWGARGEPSAEEKELATIMNRYWTNFAETGNPNGNNVPKWPLYETESETIPDIDVYGKPVARPDPRKARFDVLEKAFTNAKKYRKKGI